MAPYSTQWRVQGVEPSVPETSAGSGTLETGTPNVARYAVDPSAVGVGTYTYYVRITDAVTTTSSARGTVIIANYPSFSQPLQSTTLPEKQDLAWSVGVTGGVAPLTYRWQKRVDDGTKALVWQDLSDGGAVSGTETATLVIENVTYDDAGTYRVLVTDGLDTGIQSQADLVITQALPVTGGLGLAALSLLTALAGATALRRKRR